jgi:hypothetical protein
VEKDIHAVVERHLTADDDELWINETPLEAKDPTPEPYTYTSDDMLLLWNQGGDMSYVASNVHLTIYGCNDLGDLVPLRCLENADLKEPLDLPGGSGHALFLEWVSNTDSKIFWQGTIARYGHPVMMSSVDLYEGDLVHLSFAINEE